MNFFKALAEFFDSIFNSNSPEVIKKQEIKKCETELRNFIPVLYKANYVQPNFAQLLKILLENTRPLDDLLSSTTNSPDQKRNGIFKRELIMTGFPQEIKEKLEVLSYANRLEKVLNTTSMPVDAILAGQHSNLENLIKELNSQEMVKIDTTIAKLDQLNDICKYNYLGALKNFDPNYDALTPDYVPNFVSLVPESLENVFLDLYYLTANFQITSSMASAIFAVAQLKKRAELTQEEKNSLMSNLKIINSVFKKNLTPQVLKNFAIVASKNPSIEMKTANYRAETRRLFAEYLENQFHADENRIKTELKDRNIQSSLKELFGNTEMEELLGYNEIVNRELKENSPSTFLWITPLQILKTFVTKFLPPRIITLLNTIVVEGFFNSSTYKTDFSQAVFSCSETMDRINAFEQSFSHNERNDKDLIYGYIKDSHKNADFLKDLRKVVDTINVEAKHIIQNETNALFLLAVKVQELLEDAKKASPDIISNVKVLVGSSRNRDSYELLDRDFAVWKDFLKVMKNYAVIGDLDKKS